jgi:NB-ARC domain-containing protein/tetratricopeptide repeat protein
MQAAASWRRTPSGDPETDDQSAGTFVVPGLSTSVPGEPGPAVYCGRDEVVAKFVKMLDKRDRCHPQVLVGGGGMGKSTVARLIAAKAREIDPQRQIWWIKAANEELLAGTIVTLARQLGASTADQEAIRTHTVGGLGEVADRVWRLLENRPAGLLIIDNADDPDLLGPVDGTGWIRTIGRGLVLVTSRNRDEARWPGGVEFTQLDPLSVESATDVLIKLAPHAGDRATARDLAMWLGCLPMALRLAGMYLRRDFVAWPTFEEYQRALDTEGIPQVIDASRQAYPGTAITRTWELSLDALEKSGLPQARPLLWLLSCYAPGSRIPEEILTTPSRTVRQRTRERHPLSAILDPRHSRSAKQLTADCWAGLAGLSSLSLIQRPDSDPGSGDIELHPLIAKVTRAVLDDSELPTISPTRVRQSAVAAISAAIRNLDVGEADHWPRFHVLTPHVQELLTDTARQLGRQQRERLLDCMTSCVTSYLWSRAEPRAEQLAADALERGRDLGCEGSPSYLRLRHVHAWAVRDQDRFADAARSVTQVLAAQQALPGGLTRADTLRTRHDLAWAVGRLGRWGAAEAELGQVLAECRTNRRRRGPQLDDAFVLHTRCKLCWCIGKQGRWAAAEQGYRQLLIDRAAILGSHHADTLDTRESLGKALAWQGRWSDAEAEFQALAVGRERTLGAGHPDTLLARQLLAYAVGYQAHQRNDRKGQRAAITLLEQILRNQEFTRGPEHRNTRDSRAFLAVLRDARTPDIAWTEDLPEP